MSGVLRDRAVVVTGAGGGLGAAYAKAVADEGAAVVVNDIDPALAESVARSLPRAVADISDISQWDGAANLIDRCIEEYGRIDGLVNNAGIVRVSPPQDATGSGLRRVIEVNLLGTAFCGVLAMRAMANGRGGSIVNVTSGAALGLATTAGYSASKGGITSLTYSWAAATTTTKVRVNAVSPDADTPLARALAEHFPDLPVGVHSPESNAPVVVYLLSDMSNDVNGQVIMTGGDEISSLQRPGIERVVRRPGGWSVGAVADYFSAARHR